MESYPFYYPCEYSAFRKQKERVKKEEWKKKYLREKVEPTYCDTPCFGLKAGITY